MKTFTLCSCGKAIYDEETIEVNKCVICNCIIKTAGKIVNLDDEKKKWRYDLTNRKVQKFLKIQKKLQKEKQREEKKEKRLERKKARLEKNKQNALSNNIKIVKVNDEYHYDIPDELNINHEDIYVIVAENADNQNAYLLKKINKDFIECYSDNLGHYTWPRKSCRKYIKGIDSINSHLKHAKLLLEKFGFFVKIVMYHKKSKK